MCLQLSDFSRRYLSVMLLLYVPYSMAVDVVFDPKSPTAKILQIREINPVDKACTQISYTGTIQKVEGRYPSINIFILTNKRIKEAFQFDLDEFDMVTLKSLETLIDPKRKVRVEGQECGSGAIFYPRNIYAIP